MNEKLRKTISAALLVIMAFTLLNAQKVVAADVTAQDILGSWDARLRINKLELFGTMRQQKDAVYKQEQEPQKVTFSMHDGKLAVSFGSTPVPVTLAGGKLSGTVPENTGLFPISVLTFSRAPAGCFTRFEGIIFSFIDAFSRLLRSIVRF